MIESVPKLHPAAIQDCLMASTSKLPPTGWDAARRQTRNLESQLDAKLTQYSTLASAIARGEEGLGSRSSSPWPRKGNGSAAGGSELLEEGDVAASPKNASQDPTRLEGEITDLLSQLQRATADLTRILDDPDIPPSTIQQHAVQRHREVLTDFERDFRRCRDNVRHAIDRRDLVGRVRGDIE